MVDNQVTDQQSSTSRDDETSNRAIVQNIYESAARGELQPMWDALSGGEFTAYEYESLPWGGVHKGFDANVALTHKVAEYFDYSTIRMHHLCVDRDVVIAYGSLMWRGINGTPPREVPVAECWEIRNGRPYSIRPFFWDTASYVTQTATGQPNR